MFLAITIILFYFLVFFILGTILKNNSIVDIGWGLGFVLTTWMLFFVYRPNMMVIWINLLVTLWGLRLFYYILQRNIFKKEDFRYANWRRAWGKIVVIRAFFQVYLLQAIVMFIVGLPIYYANINSTTIKPWYFLGVVVFVIGFGLEALSDKQLRSHVKNHPGQLIQTGLWRYTRHPNYFGESVLWFGIYLTALAYSVPWYLVISPLTITLILYYISTPLMEERLRQKDGWNDYQAKTSKFFPRK